VDTQIEFPELAGLAGEVLPERAALSVVDLSGTRINVLSSSNSTSYTAPAGGGDVAYACQATNSPGTPGLLGSLGLGSANPSSAMTCIPAAATGH
jgi:hypothetical protein